MMSAQDEVSVRLRARDAGRFRRDMQGSARAVRGVDEATGRMGRGALTAGRAYTTLNTRMRVTRGLSVGVGAGMRSTWSSALALTGGLYGVGRGGAYAVRSAVNLGEQVNQTSVTFGKAAGDVQAWSRTTATSLGLSQRAALEAAGGFGGLFRTSGLLRQESADMSRRLVGLAGDLASFKNATPEEALEALRSGLVGESEPLRRFDVLLSEARVSQEAYRAGIAAQGAELTEAQKIQARFNLILRDTKAAQGDFGRTSDSLANQQRIARAQVENLSAALGDGAIPELTRAAKAGNNFLTSVNAIARRRDLDLVEKLGLASVAGKRAFGPLARDLGRELPLAFERAAPVVADAAGRAMVTAAPRAAEAFVSAFREMGPWGKLFTVGIVASRLGAFSTVGRLAASGFGRAMKRRMATGTVASAAGTVAAGRVAGGVADQLPKSLKGRDQRFRTSFRTAFRGVGTAAGMAAATALTAKIASEAANGNMKRAIELALNPLTAGGGGVNPTGLRGRRPGDPPVNLDDYSNGRRVQPPAQSGLERPGFGGARVEPQSARPRRMTPDEVRARAGSLYRIPGFALGGHADPGTLFRALERGAEVVAPSPRGGVDVHPIAPQGGETVIHTHLHLDGREVAVAVTRHPELLLGGLGPALQRRRERASRTAR